MRVPVHGNAFAQRHGDAGGAPSSRSTDLTDPTSTPKILIGDLSVIPSIELKVALK